LYLPKYKLALRGQAHERHVSSDDHQPLGDLSSETLVGPEEKALATKGFEGSGRATLEQYLLLVGAGLEGDIVRRWTENHAAQEIAKRGLHLRRAGPQQVRASQQVEPLGSMTVGHSGRRGKPIVKWPSCPVCRANLKTAERLGRHMAKVHGRSTA
jgi:hypothetical protein